MMSNGLTTRFSPRPIHAHARLRGASMSGANPATVRNPTANPSSQAPRSSPRQSEIAPSTANAAAKVKPNERFDDMGASSGLHNVSCEDPERRPLLVMRGPSVDVGILIRAPYRGRGRRVPVMVAIAIKRRGDGLSGERVTGRV